MRVLVFIGLLCALQIQAQSQSKFWDYSQQFLSNFFRQGKNAGNIITTTDSVTYISTTPPTTTRVTETSLKTTTIPPREYSTSFTTNKSSQTTPTTIITTTFSSTLYSDITTERNNISTVTGTTAGISTITESSTASTIFDTTTTDYIATTGEPRENPNSHDFYLTSKREKPLIKLAANISQNLLPLPAGASAALVKPTKYHYYPHNQHIYLLPECAIQQVCNAVYVRLNWTQPLCACPSRYRDPCSASLNSDDLHTTELSINRRSKKAVTLVKTCEPTNEMRICRAPRDWSLLALQNIRTGKSHYLVICRCSDNNVLEGPMSHDQPTYASVPGIRVYGMMCVDNKRRGRPLRDSRSFEQPPFPWKKAQEFAKIAIWD